MGASWACAGAALPTALDAIEAADAALREVAGG